MNKKVAETGNLAEGRPVSLDVNTSFETFYHGTAPRLLRFAYGLTGDIAEAQDMTQEAYARAWARWKRLQSYESPESWLRLVVSRLAADRWRWLKVRRNAPAPRTDQASPADENLVLLVAELKKLPMQQRKALVLHYLLDRPIADIAAETGASINTVKSWLSRGRANLAAQLNELEPLPALPPVDTLAARARQRARHAIAKVAAAFAATAATAAAFIVWVQPVPPPALPLPVPFVRWDTQPAPVLTYGSDIVVGYVATDDKRAYALLRQHGAAGGRLSLGAIDLATGRPAWTPADLGRFGDMNGIALTDAAIVAFGERDDGTQPDHMMQFVDPDTGKLLWQRGREGMDFELFRRTLVVKENGQIGGFDLRTGAPLWTMPVPSKGVLAERDPNLSGSQYWERAGDEPLVVVGDDSLRTIHPDTGRVIAERRVQNPRNHTNAYVIGDRVYTTSEKALKTMRLNGTEKSWQTLMTFNQQYEFKGCGRTLVCVQLVRDQEVVALDPETATETWRHRSDFGGYSLSSPNGLSAQTRAEEKTTLALYDAAGNDIAPPGYEAVMGWIDAGNALLQKNSKPISHTPGSRMIRTLAISGYSLANRQLIPLGELVTIGFCSTTSSLLICPGEQGVMIYRFTP